MSNNMHPRKSFSELIYMIVLLVKLLCRLTSFLGFRYCLNNAFSSFCFFLLGLFALVKDATFFLIIIDNNVNLGALIDIELQHLLMCTFLLI